MPKRLAGQSMPRSAHIFTITKYQDAGKRSRTTAFDTAVSPTPSRAAIFARPIAFAIWECLLMDGTIPHIVVQCNPSIGGLPKPAPCGTNLPKRETPLAYEEIGLRLARVRTGFSDLNQRDWAKKHDFNGSQYNNWEKGVRRIPVDSAERLADAYGLSLDWIYRGKLDGLTEYARKVL